MRSGSLDIIRIFAALCVVWLHLLDWTAGFIGVQIFFTLSGYLIAGSMVGKTWKEFVGDRGKRLLPGAFACSIFTAGVLAITGNMPADWIVKLAGSAALWPLGPWIDGVYWTLGMEITFYGIAAITIGLHSDLEKSMLWIAGASAALWTMATMAGQYGGEIQGVPRRLIDLTLMKDAIFFATGVLIYKAAENGWSKERVAGIIFTTIFGMLPIAMETLVRSAGNPILPISIWMSSIVIISMPWSWRSPKWLSIASMSTYPLYLIHNEAGQALMEKGADTWAVIIGMIIAAGWITVMIDPAILRITKLIAGRQRIKKRLTR